MRRLAVSLTSLILLAGAMVPAASADEVTTAFRGAGSARALDLSLPLLKSLPLLGGLSGDTVSPLGAVPAVNQLLKGLTVGITSGVFVSKPAASGAAIGLCGLLPDGVGLPPLPLPALPSLPVLPVDVPCTQSSVETSSAPEGNPGDGMDSCSEQLQIAIVNLTTSCANSASRIEGAMPVTLNKGGVALLNLELANLPDLLGLNVAATRDALVDQVSSVLGNVLGTVQGLLPVTPLDLQGAVESLLAQVRSLDLTRLATVQAGTTSTNATTQGNGTSVVAEAAGGKIGLLGITNPLTDGLVIIDVSAARAVAAWDNATDAAASTATPAVATVQVRDLLDLVPGDYLTAAIPALDLNNILAPLAGTALASSVELASASPAQSGQNVVASTSGVLIHLVKGLGESAPGARDGGIKLRFAAADAAVSGEVVNVVVAPPLPHTGGPTTVFMLGAALLGAGGTTLAAVRRRLLRREI